MYFRIDLKRGGQCPRSLVGKAGFVVISQKKNCHDDLFLSRPLEDASGLELFDELGDGCDLDACLAAGWLLGLQNLELRRGGDAEIRQSLLVERLLLRLHDIRQRGVARLVEAQVRGDDGGELYLDRLQAAIHFAGDGGLVGGELDLRGEGGLRRPHQRGQHLAGLVRIVVDRLLADDYETRLFGIDDALQDLGDSERLDGVFGLDQDRPVGAHGKRGAKRVLCLGGTDRKDDHFRGLAAFFQAKRLFHRNFIEGIHRHFDIG
ncbi:conserved hypothetical protein [Agrobacterium tumefaciens str. B6]|uniref:NAD-specific glutamate dehydrogenase n=1 Tax=Agrobacterium tumefaciens str. B6 TaxID=1183423 RepID=A0A822VBJ3_AGRTU|nr:conserved hypothetical protein [Agrobacterium tumefaciens str. B6]